MTAGKVDDGRAKVLSAKVGGGGKANIAAQDALFLRQQRLGVARLLQYAPRGMIKIFPRVGQGDSARGAMEQAGLVTLFHRLQAGRHGGRRKRQPSTGGGESPRLGDCHQ